MNSTSDRDNAILLLASAGLAIAVVVLVVFGIVKNEEVKKHKERIEVIENQMISKGYGERISSPYGEEIFVIK